MIIIYIALGILLALFILANLEAAKALAMVAISGICLIGIACIVGGGGYLLYQHITWVN